MPQLMPFFWSMSMIFVMFLMIIIYKLYDFSIINLMEKCNNIYFLKNKWLW